MKVMTRLAWFLTYIFLVLETSFAATSKEVSYKSGDETVKAILYAPAGQGPFPGIVVIHEWWGLNDWVKEQASKWRIKATPRWPLTFTAGEWRTMPALRTNSCAVCLRIALCATCTQPCNISSRNPTSRRIGSVPSAGAWVGGALDVALQEPALTATVINYGHLGTDPAALNKINAAILGNVGGKDQGMPAEDVKKFEESLKQAGKQVNIKIYPYAGHAFENPNNPKGLSARRCSRCMEAHR